MELLIIHILRSLYIDKIGAIIYRIEGKLFTMGSYRSFEKSATWIQDSLCSIRVILYLHEITKFDRSLSLAFFVGT